MGKRLLILTFTIISLTLFFTNRTFAYSNPFDLVSKSSFDAPGNNISFTSDISGDGRFIVFTSLATNLTTNKTFYHMQTYVKDTVTKSVYLISHNKDSNDGANADSTNPRITPDGKFIVFSSRATDLTGTTSRNSQIYIAQIDDYTKPAKIELISRNKDSNEGNSDSSIPNISDDGRTLSFESKSTNLVDGINNDTPLQVYVAKYDSGIGTYNITLGSSDIFAKATEYISENADISHDGQYLAFSTKSANIVKEINKTNEFEQSYLKNLRTQEVKIISTNRAGEVSNGINSVSSISSDNNIILLVSNSNNLIPSSKNNTKMQIYLKNLKQNTIRLISHTPNNMPGNMDTSFGSMTPDGKFVVFSSQADNLIKDTTKDQIYFYNSNTERIGLITKDSDGRPSTGWLENPQISSNGLSITFYGISNLIYKSTIENVYSYNIGIL